MDEKYQEFLTRPECIEILTSHFGDFGRNVPDFTGKSNEYLRLWTRYVLNDKSCKEDGGHFNGKK